MMADEVTATTPADGPDAAKAAFFEASRRGASYEELEVLGRQIWPPEGAEDRMAHAGTVQADAHDSAFKAANVVAFRREDAGPALTLAGIDARIAEIDAADAPGRLQTERVRQAHQVERDHLLQRRYAVIEGTNAAAGQPAAPHSRAAAIDPGPTPAAPLVQASFARMTHEPEAATLTMPADLPTGATVNPPVMNGFLASVEELGLSAGWAQRFFEYDAATLGDPPDPATPPDSAELALAREVVALFPPALQNHIRTRRHLERREFVSTVAKAGAPILRRSSAERNDIRQRIARRFYTKGEAR